MTRWRIDDIREEYKNIVKNISPDKLEEYLVELLTAIHPISATLKGLIQNPDVKYGGMAVTSDLFPYHHEETNDDIHESEPYGSRLTSLDKSVKWDSVHFEFDEPKPENIELEEVYFKKGKNLHESFNILSIYQYGLAASIFIGSFDSSDIKLLADTQTMILSKKED